MHEEEVNSFLNTTSIYLNIYPMCLYIIYRYMQYILDIIQSELKSYLFIYMIFILVFFGCLPEFSH